MFVFSLTNIILVTEKRSCVSINFKCEAAEHDRRLLVVTGLVLKNLSVCRAGGGRETDAHHVVLALCSQSAPGLDGASVAPVGEPGGRAHHHHGQEAHDHRGGVGALRLAALNRRVVLQRMVRSTRRKLTLVFGAAFFAAPEIRPDRRARDASRVPSDCRPTPARWKQSHHINNHLPGTRALLTYHSISFTQVHRSQLMYHFEGSFNIVKYI